MFEQPFTHYLTYGATDQKTVRALRGMFDGLIVPGTVAAFQREATRGFVLSLSAASAGTPYVIDPRTPLFQQALPEARQSHVSLAQTLGDLSLVGAFDPDVGDFTTERIASMAESWVAFNRDLAASIPKRFEKYAARLGEAVDQDNVQAPQHTLAPYFVASDPEDPWWSISNRLFERTQALEPAAIRVVAARSRGSLRSLLGKVSERQVVIWASALNEVESEVDPLFRYGRAINAGRRQEKTLFALYGGYFSVLMATVGLKGSCHGIGFGESRAWVELPQSGPPPKRYYLRQIHRYVSQDLAYQLWRRRRELVACNCPHCEGRSPLLIEYHDLMKHSVWCRTQEIDAVRGWDLQLALERLGDDARAFEDALDTLDLPAPIGRQAYRAFAHLPRWYEALERLANTTPLPAT